MNPVIIVAGEVAGGGRDEGDVERRYLRQEKNSYKNHQYYYPAYTNHTNAVPTINAKGVRTAPTTTFQC